MSTFSILRIGLEILCFRSSDSRLEIFQRIQNEGF
jgi:hypothetical protein